MNWTLDQLAALDAIAREGSFAAAARRQGRVTSAISYQVRTLEESLGLVLFDRSGHRATLTPEGHIILEEARTILSHTGDLARRASELKQGWEPVLKVVVEGSFPQAPVMRALRRFSERDLPTRVQMKVEHLSGVEARFERTSAHLMIALEPDGESLTTVPLPDIEMVLVAHCEHPIHQHQGLVGRGALKAWVELRVSDSNPRPVAGQSGRLRERLALGAAQVCELSDFHSKREALLQGVGPGWLPRHLMEGTEGVLREVPFDEGARVTLTPLLAHRRGAALGRGARLFMSLLSQEVLQTA